jgi:hypothetical protein
MNSIVEVDFSDIVAWRKLAENTAEYQARVILWAFEDVCKSVPTRLGRDKSGKWLRSWRTR